MWLALKYVRDGVGDAIFYTIDILTQTGAAKYEA